MTTQEKMISIHAPPRGATRWEARWESHRHISIHAPPRGATTSPDTTTGRDNHISIHAPPRGATDLYLGKHDWLKFQFTPLREGRRRVVFLSFVAFYFNSRPSARGDTVDFTIDTDATIFQFTPLREGRPDSHGGIGRGAVFQFTPLREGRH